MQPRTAGTTFAAIVFLVAGTLHVVWGVAGLANKEYFDEQSLLFSSLQTWGWIYLLVGAFQVAVGGLVLSGSGLGYALGMFAAFLGILANFMSVGAYPIWSVMLIALNFFIIWTLATQLE